MGDDRSGGEQRDNRSIFECLESRCGEWIVDAAQVSQVEERVSQMGVLEGLMLFIEGRLAMS